MNKKFFPQAILESDFNNCLVIGASGGIGAAVCDFLQRSKGVETLSRRADGFDLQNEESIESAAAQYQEAGKSFDLIFDATGVLEAGGDSPEKSFLALRPYAMAHAFAINAIGPALLFKHFAPLLTKDNKSVFATLSARVGSIGDNRLGGWISYRASKAALNQIVRCAAIEIKRIRPKSVVVALHPGTIETPLTRQYAKGRYTATPSEAAGQMLTVLNNLEPNDTGKFFDYAGKEVIW